MLKEWTESLKYQIVIVKIIFVLYKNKIKTQIDIFIRYNTGGFPTSKRNDKHYCIQWNDLHTVEGKWDRDRLPMHVHVYYMKYHLVDVVRDCNNKMLADIKQYVNLDYVNGNRNGNNWSQIDTKRWKMYMDNRNEYLKKKKADK